MRSFSIAALFVVVLIVSGCCDALRFYVRDRERRCFHFEAPYGARVLGHRSIANGKGKAQLSLEVKRASGGELVYESHSGDPKDAMFSFTTPPFDNSQQYDEYDYEEDEQMAVFDACLMLSLDDTMHTTHGERAVTFWINVDYRESVKSSSGRATTQGMSRMTNALRGMHKTLKSLLMDLAELQLRERRLVRRTKATARSVGTFTAVSLTVLVAVSLVQFLHYKKLFTAKKLV
ncbi:unnamed protein product [Agarophyton chilense]